MNLSFKIWVSYGGFSVFTKGFVNVVDDQVVDIMNLIFSWRRLKPAGLLLFAAPKSKQKALVGPTNLGGNLESLGFSQ